MRALSNARYATNAPAARPGKSTPLSVARPPASRWRCACGGGCPRCAKAGTRLGGANEAAESQADRMATAALAASSAPELTTGPPARIAPQLQQLPFESTGELLPASLASDMGNCFGADLSGVRVHRGAEAGSSAKALGADAYVLGSNIVFGAGRYAPESGEGRRLLAHELAHVVQAAVDSRPVIRRYCSDPDFCTRYATTAEADSAEWWLRNTYMAAEGLATYGSEVEALYESFLDRSPGDSLAPVVFDSDSSYLVGAFRDSWDTADDVDAVLGLVGERLDRSPARLRDGQRVMMSLSNFLSDSEMENRPINYSNPLSVAGHIAGGIGSSAAGDDYRSIVQANVWLEQVSLPIAGTYVKVSMSPKYEVFDAIDFCPGDCGSPAEQLVTIPMSRLEASGRAYDVPFKVIFRVPERSERFWV